MAQNEYRGLEHGVLQRELLPPKEQFGVQAQQARRHEMKTTDPATQSPYYSPATSRENSRSIQRGHRRRNQLTRGAAAAGGTGMQAIFLSSNRKSSGTGVFLPRRDGIDPKSSNKPAVPVLLPWRVVHALNLNVRELGQHRPQPGEPKNCVEKIDEKSENNKEDDACLSPEIYLPEEWTY